jgi:hypothetical protein
MEKILRKDTKFQWNDECQHGMDTLKENMVITPILVFLDLEKTFHIHVDASTITLGVILAHLGEGDLDHPIAFAGRKLLESEQYGHRTNISISRLGEDIPRPCRCVNHSTWSYLGASKRGGFGSIGCGA